VIDLRQGDCLEVLATLPAASVDAVITDPPYFQPAVHYVGPRGEKVPKKRISDMSILELFFRTFIDECVRVLKPTGTIYLFCDGQSYPIAFTGLYAHCKHVRPLIWDKVTSFNGYTWRHQHELIAWGELDESPRIPTGDGDILRCPAVPVDDRIHPAEKPVALIAKLLGKLPEGAVVLDPFMGSGAVGEACHNSRRSFVGIEADPTYFSIAQKRIEQAQAQLVMAL
jgi:site-specific DNA-methyltransferase (adenine-specific)